VRRALALVAAVAAALAFAAEPATGPGPDFAVTTLDGAVVSRASLAGKVVVVDFWATWCAPCVEEIPGYVRLQERYRADGLVVLGVALDRKGADHVRAWAAKRGVNYLLAMGDDALVEAFGGFDAIPTTFLLGRDGTVLHRKTGAMPAADYERLVRDALGRPRE
jgi:thiol-disulfide isomerase/thioredoxin